MPLDPMFALLSADLPDWPEEDRARLDRLLTGICQHPQCETTPGELYHQNTQYGHRLSNWTCLCPEHKAQNDKEWDDRWREYRAEAL